MTSLTTSAGGSPPAVANVIPFRPRYAVPRSRPQFDIPIVRSSEPSHGLGESRIYVLDGRVLLAELYMALSLHGLRICYDQRTGDFRVMRAVDADKERQP